ncbi:MerR family transcriptional regulator [Bryobacter aggregatus]|uniref:MerR family transcriptional regulator n=1 Tax=Bryobacter aggregatus TaxID=360054 RepID=UPI0009B5D40F|nr:MerR family transcriptional regulator [Bryobacter aggregatus]
MKTRYPIRAVAKIAGLSPDTLRAWERRYQAVVPERSERGRLYGPEHIERLLLLNQLVQRGHAIGGIASRSDEELRVLLSRQHSQSVSVPTPPADMLDPMLAAIENFDTLRASDELSRLAAALSPRDLVYQVVVPLMREVGIRWHNGTLAIAQEHLVSQMLRTLLGNMMRLFRPLNPAMTMVLSTPAGESHEFGILAAAMLASLAGVDPVYLGPNLPAREIADAARRTSAKVVALSITFWSKTTQEELNALAAAMPEGAELWVGGEGSADLDLTLLGHSTIRIKDLPALETECRRWRN